MADDAGGAEPYDAANGTRYPGLFAALCAPFEAWELKERTGAGSRTLCYITARTAMNRFDQVVGPENWRNEYRLETLADGKNAVACMISVRIGGEWVSKQDVGGFKEMTEKNRQGEQVDDEENSVKTGWTDAFKRCSILWGVGRYLYRDGVPEFARALFGEVEDRQVQEAARAEGRGENLPRREPAPRTEPRAPAHEGHGPPASHGGQGQGQHQGPPRTGKALFAWTKDQEQRHEVGLLKWMNQWGRLQEFPARLVDWNPDQVSLAYQEATRKLASLQGTPAGSGRDGDPAY